MRFHVACVLLALSACGKVEGDLTDATPDHDGTPIDTPALPIDAPPVVHWQKLATVNATLDLGNNRGFMAVGLGGTIYFAPIFDTGNTTFRGFDTNTLQLSGPLTLPPGVQNDFQASGYGAIFVADARYLYLIGDDGERYDPTGNNWTTVPGYGPGFTAHRGESLGAWESNNNTIFMIGGRDDSNQDQATAIRFDGVALWNQEPGQLPYTTSSGVAYAPPGNNLTYVAGGRSGDSNRRHLAVHPTGTPNWNALPDAPGDLSSPIGMGHYTAGGVTRIFVATQSSLFFYNPTSSTWDRTIGMPSAAHAQVVMIAGIPHAMVQNGTMADVFRLISID